MRAHRIRSSLDRQKELAAQKEEVKRAALEQVQQLNSKVRAAKQEARQVKEEYARAMRDRDEEISTLKTDVGILKHEKVLFFPLPSPSRIYLASFC